MLLFAQPPLRFQQRAQQPSSRERYLRALAEEEAARKAYAEDLAEQYCNPYGSNRHQRPSHFDYEYDKLREARAREYHRQQQLRAHAAELERERQVRRRAAELEQRRALEARQRQDEQARRDEYVNSVADILLGRHSYEKVPGPGPFTPTPDPPRPAHGNLPPRAAATNMSIAQREQAAVAIQKAFRSRLSRQKTLSTLNVLRNTLSTYASSLTFPLQPDFDPSSPTPRLLYSPTNAPIHAYEEQLVRLLSKLDEVQSGGDVQVRKARKALASDIERVLEGLDAMKEGAWLIWKDSLTGFTSTSDINTEETTVTVGDCTMVSGEVGGVIASQCDDVLVARREETRPAVDSAPSNVLSAGEHSDTSDSGPIISESSPMAVDGLSTGSVEEQPLVVAVESSHSVLLDQDSTTPTVSEAPEEPDDDAQSDDDDEAVTFLEQSLLVDPSSSSQSIVAPPILNDADEEIDEVEDIVHVESSDADDLHVDMEVSHQDFPPTPEDIQEEQGDFVVL